MRIFTKLYYSTIKESFPTNYTPKAPLDEIDELCEAMDADLEKDVTIPDDVLKSFQLKKQLNPDVWVDDKINPEIRKKLIKIATDSLVKSFYLRVLRLKILHLLVA